MVLITGFKGKNNSSGVLAEQISSEHLLGKTKGKQLNEHLSDYVIFDLETTGISCYRDQVVEISGVKVINGNI
ncbi:MAG: hypothetical protein IKR23_06050, partial [Lachnospiraceae bacterium]|nr:hypothetical protein [Lachnospiraceae bacterium]